MIGRALVDLDREFGDRIEQIDTYVRSRGYEAYKRANSRLAGDIVAGVSQPTLLATSSGFLSSDNPADALLANRKLMACGYSISLLPSSDLIIASDIIVERQAGRGLSYDAVEERRKIRERFQPYKSDGDMLVISASPPARIAEAIAERLLPG